MTWLKALGLLLAGTGLGWFLRGGCEPVVIPPKLAAEAQAVTQSALPETVTAVLATVKPTQQARKEAGDTAAHLLASVDTSGVDSICRFNLRQTIRAASIYATNWVQAEGQVNQLAGWLGVARDSLALQRQVVGGLVAVINNARTPRVYRWAAGPVFEPGRLMPVGGSLDRDLGRLRIRVEVTQGPAEPLTGRVGLAVRW